MDEAERQALEVMRDYDAAHPYWKQERRDREIKEAKEAEERAQRAHDDMRRRELEQQTPTDAAAWWKQHDERVYQCIKLWVEQWYPQERDALTDAVGQTFGEHRASVRETLTNLKERVIRLETTSNFEGRFTKLAHEVKRGSEIPQGELLEKFKALQRRCSTLMVASSLIPPNGHR